MKPTILITKNYDVYIPEMYGAETWGNGYHQESMICEKGIWKVCDWHYGGKFEEDSYMEYDLDIIYETTSEYKAKVFLNKNGHKEKVNDLKVLLDMYKKFEKDFGSCKRKKKTVQKSKKS